MAQNYAQLSHRKKKKAPKKTVSAWVWVSLALVITAVFFAGLYFMKFQSAQKVVALPTSVAEKSKPKSQLPSRPEETWSYIKALESRTIVPDTKSIQLNEKQKAELKRVEQKEQEKKAALARQKQENITKQQELDQLIANLQLSTEKTDKEKANMSKSKAVENVTNKKVEESKVLIKVESNKSENNKIEVNKTENKKTAAKFGLQCGAFNDRARAENLQARLAMQGFNARIVESEKWKRVVIGPIGDRSAATAAQKQASAIAGCRLIGM